MSGRPEKRCTSRLTLIGLCPPEHEPFGLAILPPMRKRQQMSEKRTNQNTKSFQPKDYHTIGDKRKYPEFFRGISLLC